jgi:hypothetical protein
MAHTKSQHGRFTIPQRSAGWAKKMAILRFLPGRPAAGSNTRRNRRGLFEFVKTDRFTHDRAIPTDRASI